MLQERKLVFRGLTEADTAEVLILLRDLHQESVFSTLPFSERKAGNRLRSVLEESRANIGIVAEYSGEIVGLVHCGLGQYIVADGPLVLSIQTFYVAPRIRKTLLGGKVATKLFRKALGVGKSANAEIAVFSAGTGVSTSTTHSIATKLGMKFCGGNYVGKIA
jgi:hypothetical protein